MKRFLVSKYSIAMFKVFKAKIYILHIPMNPLNIFAFAFCKLKKPLDNDFLYFIKMVYDFAFINF